MSQKKSIFPALYELLQIFNRPLTPTNTKSAMNYNIGDYLMSDWRAIKLIHFSSILHMFTINLSEVFLIVIAASGSYEVVNQ